MSKPSKEQMVVEAWKRGLLRYKLRKHQQQLYSFIWDKIDNKTHRAVVLCRRRKGKSFVTMLVCMELAIRTPGAMIRYSAPTGKQLKNIYKPISRIITEDCPEELKPKWSYDVLMFPNGSEIHFAGTDSADSRESLRGTASHLNVSDEAGSQSELDYTIRSILSPQTESTDGLTLLISTPSITPEHPFHDFTVEAEMGGNLLVRSLYDDKDLMPEKEYKRIFDKAVEESGGEHSTHFKREYGVEFCVDEERAIIRYWEEQFKQDVTRDELFKYYHKYEAMDIGGKDLTAVLFAYYDYTKAQLIIEDEWHAPLTPLTRDIAAAVKEKEQELDYVDVHLRIADNNNIILLNDLGVDHDLAFLPTSKERGKDAAGLHAMVNKVNTWFEQGRIIINPRCKMLLSCVKGGIWTATKDKFDRRKALGHFDHLAALVYLIRNVDDYTNPVPRIHGLHPATHHITPEMRDKRESANAAAVRSIFNK